jgi:hypothetical protein
MVAIAEAMAVAVNTGPAPIPGILPSIPGLTARMYAIVKKVVKPAASSPRTVTPWALNLKNFSIVPP